MEKDNSQQKNLLIRLVKAIDLLFRTEKRKYTYLTKEGLALIQKRLLADRFKFSSMFRCSIPKPNKGGKVRLLTRRNILVMKAIDILLQSIFERIFLTDSQGLGTNHWQERDADPYLVRKTITGKASSRIKREKKEYEKKEINESLN